MSLVTVNWRPTPKQMRIFGLSLVGGFGLFGLLAMFHAKADTLAYVFWAFGAVAGSLALLNLKVALPIALWLLAAVSIFTVGQRMVHVYRQAQQVPTAPGGQG